MKKKFRWVVFILSGALLLTVFSSLNVSRAEDIATKKERVKAALAVHGGEGYENAAPMEFNREYKLDHHQKPGEMSYFSIPVEPNTIVTLETRTFDKGVSWNKGRRVVTTEPFAGLELQDEGRMPVTKVVISGTPNAINKASYRYRKPDGNRYYVLVGNPVGGTNKDEMIFKATATPFISGDLGSEQDAGPGPGFSLPIVADRYYPVNSIGGGDLKDVYSFSASKKEWYAVAVRAVDSIPVPLQVTVWGPGKKGENKPEKIVSYLSGGGDQVITKSFEIPQNDLYFVEVDVMGRVKDKSLYSLQLSRVSESGEKSSNVSHKEEP